MYDIDKLITIKAINRTTQVEVSLLSQTAAMGHNAVPVLSSETHGHIYVESTLILSAFD
jgi:hypothetical protein